MALHPALGAEPTLTRAAVPTGQAAARILFVCTQNSARSQIAEAILRDVGGPRVSVFSAGTHPGQVHPLTWRILSENGIDDRGLRSKSLSEFEGQPFDYIVTVCDHARENCPVFGGTGVRQLHWSLPDPVAVNDEAARHEAFVDVTRQIQTRIVFFLAQIDADLRV
jgi:arsenate reductase